VVRLSLGAGINFVVLEKLKHLMLEHLPRTAGQLDWLQAALVGGEPDSTSLTAARQQLLMHTDPPVGAHGRALVASEQ
jgi:hypothetical protein